MRARAPPPAAAGPLPALLLLLLHHAHGQAGPEATSPRPATVAAIALSIKSRAIQDSRCYLMNGGAVESFFISEDTPVGSVIGTLSVNGDPAETTGDITLKLQERGAAVGIAPGTKNLTLLRALDREEKRGPSNVYVNVRCDRRRTSDPSFIIPVSVRVWDVNDNAPVWSGAPYRVRLSELTAVGSRVLPALRATDADQPGPHATIHYSVLPGKNSEYFGFANELDSVLVVKKPLDFETLSNFTVQLRAQDQGSPPLHNDTLLTVEVLDADDQNPKFSHDHYTALLPDNAQVPDNYIFSGIGIPLEPLNLLSSSYAEENKTKKRKLENVSCYECTEGEQNTSKIVKDKDVDLNNLEYNVTSCTTPLNIPSSEVESVLNTPKTHQLKQKLKQKSLLAQKRLLKIKILQRKNKRLTMKNMTLKDIMSQLKKKGFSDSNQNTALGEFSNDIVLALKQKRSKKRRSIIKYTPSMKKFALTLNYYSPAGYKFVRRQLLASLPHPSTLSKWYQAIDGKPGFTEEAFKALRLKYSFSDKRLCCLIVDEMAIRQQKIFNGKTVDGLVTFGPSDEIATQVYVILLVALNDSFKLPLGYYFVNGIAADQRCNIIKMCLEKCHEVGAEVVSLTFDGCASNIATAKTLGCNFEDPSNLKSNFDHPITGEPVVVILDPCHMLKLVRNTMEAKKILIDQNGEKVQWKLLENLRDVQDNIGLHFGNKLTHRHLEFRNNIMNVKLATQTLSNSVASALKLCSLELNMANFQDANATILFIETFNNLFDIFNAKSLSGQGYKHPFSIEQKETLFSFLDQAKQYIEGLLIDVQSKRTQKVKGQIVTESTITQKQLIKTQSKTGFLGLLICISSFKLLFERLVENRKVLKFILPYKFSQDHLELFFGVIRNHGRCNNNPNARQFMGIYRKTLINLELRSKFTGNCIPLEDIPILNCSSAINATTPGFRHKLQETEEISKMITDPELNNCSVLSHSLDVDILLPQTVEQIIGYIGGFVAKRLRAKLDCIECIELLQAKENLYFHKLIYLKDLGGLLYPSMILFKICYRAESLIRQILKINGNKNSLTRACNTSILAHQCFVKIIERSDIVTSLRQSHDYSSCSVYTEHYLRVGIILL